MYDFLDIILSVVIFLSPHDINRIQMWPYAGDSKQTPAGSMNELSLTYQKDGNQWCEDYGDTNKGPCLIVTDGKLVDEHGKILLDIKDNLKVTNGTNYVFKPKDFDNPLKFSVSDGNGEKTIKIYDNTNVVREIRVKMWKANVQEPAQSSDTVTNVKK
jgi:hypothetical protein